MKMEKMIPTKSFDYYHSNFTIPKYGWNENVYVEYEGAIRAMRFTKIEFTLQNIENGYSHLSNEKNVYHVKIAGIGDVTINGEGYRCYDFPLRYLMEADGFNNSNREIEKMNNILVRLGKEYSQMEWLSQCFGLEIDKVGKFHSFGVSNGQACSIVRYKWDGVKPVPVYIEVPNKLYYTYDKGFHFEEECSLPPNTYPTSASCKDANTIKVVEFTDEDTNTEEELREQIKKALSKVITNSLDKMIDKCVEDVITSSEFPHYNDADISMAIHRLVLFKY